MTFQPTGAQGPGYAAPPNPPATKSKGPIIAAVVWTFLAYAASLQSVIAAIVGGVITWGAVAAFFVGRLHRQPAILVSFASVCERHWRVAITVLATTTGGLLLGRFVAADVPRQEAQREQWNAEREHQETERQAKKDAKEKAAADEAAEREAKEAEEKARRARVVTVSLSRLTEHRDLEDGQKVCVCGFVQDAGSSPDHTVDGSKYAVRHHVTVTGTPGGAFVDGAATAMCWWIEGQPPKQTLGQKVCVVGSNKGGLIVDCGVVEACPKG